jgi:two-component system, OmpR family, sensor kinase
MSSLRRSALIWTTALLAVVGVIAFLISYHLARREAADFLDGQLRLIALNAGDALGDTATPGAQSDPEDDFVVTIWSASSETLRNAKSGIALPRSTSQGFTTIHAAGDDWRVYMASDGRRFVQVAQRMSVREEMAQTAAIQAGAPILIVIPLAWLVIGWSLGQVLGPMSNLTSAIAGRGVDSKEQIPVAYAPSEVRPLIEAMNVLTARQQRALEVQKRFVSDAAHELRTPLAALRIQIDNLRAQPNESQRALIGDLDAGIRRSSILVEQLLRLARSDEASAQAPSEDVDITDLVKQCVADFVPIAEAKGIDLGLVGADPVIFAGWPDDLKTLFGNLLDNAIRYTPEGGVVDVSVRRNGSEALVEVLDSGCGVAEEEIPRVFDRFHRAAAPDIEGNGLGLAIADSIARRHDLVIRIENRPDRSGLRVSVSRSPTAPALIRP